MSSTQVVERRLLLPPQAVTAIGPTTATGNGNVTALGSPNPTQHGVAWSTVANPTISDSHTSDGPVGATGTFTSAITGLTAGTVYHVRAYATNTAGTSYGSDVNFTASTGTRHLYNLWIVDCASRHYFHQRRGLGRRWKRWRHVWRQW